MYKLFLTFRYLTRKKIVIFPVLVVWLCVMMLVIVTSIMGGFVDRVRETNRDLYGDIIISAGTSTYGWSGYDQLADALKKQFPDIKATTPTVQVYGLLYVPPPYGQTRGIIVTGVRPGERSQVSKFRESLFLQYLSPKNAVDDLAPRLPASKADLIKYAIEKGKDAKKNYDDAARRFDELVGPFNPAVAGMRMPGVHAGTVRAPRPNYWWLLGILIAIPIVWFQIWRTRRNYGGGQRASGYITAGVLVLICIGIIFLGTFWPVLFPHDLAVAEDTMKQASFDLDRARRTLDLISRDNVPQGPFNNRADLEKVLMPAEPNFAVPMVDAAFANFEALSKLMAFLRERNALPADVSDLMATGRYPDAHDKLVVALKGLNLTKPQLDELARQIGIADDGVIVGSQVGFYRRDVRGNFLRPIEPSYQQVTLTVFPPSKKGNVNATPENARSHKFTMVDDLHTGVFDTDATNVVAPFELVQEMAGMRPSADEAQDPQLNFEPRCHELLIKLNGNISPGQMRDFRKAIDDFVGDYQVAHQGNFTNTLLDVQTWDEKQKRYLDAVGNEKVMMTFILGLMSLVVLVVIFLIFYQIVRDKTRDIGIIKAVGGSEEGVAGIFLTYGLAIGLVGGGLGALSGVLFVTHTNQIHEWIFHTTGIIIWDRSVYIFDHIPDQVRMSDVFWYLGVALVAGIIGALIPAIVAGAEDPVQAVRYE